MKIKNNTKQKTMKSDTKKTTNNIIFKVGIGSGLITVIIIFLLRSCPQPPCVKINIQTTLLWKTTKKKIKGLYYRGASGVSTTSKEIGNEGNISIELFYNELNTEIKFYVEDGKGNRKGEFFIKPQEKELKQRDCIIALDDTHVSSDNNSESIPDDKGNQVPKDEEKKGDDKKVEKNNAKMDTLREITIKFKKNIREKYVFKNGKNEIKVFDGDSTNRSTTLIISKKITTINIETTKSGDGSISLNPKENIYEY